MTDDPYSSLYAAEGWESDDGSAAAAYAEDRRRRRQERLERQAAVRHRRKVWLSAIALVLVVSAVAATIVTRAIRSTEAPAATTTTLSPASSITSAATLATLSAPVAELKITEPAAAKESGSGAVPEAVADAAVDYPGAPSVDPEVIYNVETKKKLVAITLDDGIPMNEKTLELFEKRHVHVTTFLLGQAVKANPKLVKRMHKAGIEIASHGWNHDSFAKMSESEMRDQLNRTQKLITKITGNQAPYFRPPYGATNDTVKRVAADEGYKLVMWDGSFVDTYGKATADYSYNKALKNLHPGAIILCHWGKDSTYGAMKLLLDDLDERGYQVVTISELLAARKKGQE